MSNIYIQEPPTSGKVLLKTTVGDIDIELWTKEAPLACRNFIQLCMDGYYNGTIFHRLVKKFIVQGGDPNGDGSGGESCYGEPFKDEFHSRLRFVRRGLVAMANAGKNDNGSQFFFTLGATPELQNMHTLFGKVTGDTVYNMLKLEDGLVDESERPHYPQKITKTIVLNNPFEDIVPRVVKTKDDDKDKGRKKKEKGVKNFGLLSFGDEAEEEEQETNNFVQKNIAGKSKSTHDVLNDPKLSKKPYSLKEIDPKIAEKFEKEERSKEKIEEEAENVRNKLKRKIEEAKEEKIKEKVKEAKVVESDSDSDYDLDSERTKAKTQKAEKIREEINKLKKDYQSDKKSKEKLLQQKQEEETKKEASTDVMTAFKSEQEKYAEKAKTLPKKGASREQFTLSLLEKFKSKLNTIKDQIPESEEEDHSGPQTSANDDDVAGDNWMSHKLQFEKTNAILAKDASTKADDWYDVYDPRNPLNKRKRGEKSEKPGNKV